MSPSIPDLVQTSNNLARVIVQNGRLSIQCLTRSSVNSERDDLAHAIRANFELLNVRVDHSGAYSGWQPAPDSSIVKLMSALYTELFDDQPHVAACHAALSVASSAATIPRWK